ncbi:hypothetical protein ACJ73_04923 [Blastomyces percursus]|uniref:Uncharacterized protein n=1 Tax=Blastomyces percursus TaxID=1658174 RepID=A0A1J9QU22_9EURO|nr:hypothetical protein ACJ73_04923 [Blastomyces percursus]
MVNFDPLINTMSATGERALGWGQDRVPDFAEMGFSSDDIPVTVSLGYGVYDVFVTQAKMDEFGRKYEQSIRTPGTESNPLVQIHGKWGTSKRVFNSYRTALEDGELSNTGRQLLKQVVESMGLSCTS